MHRYVALPALMLMLGGGVAHAQSTPPAPPAQMNPAQPNTSNQPACAPDTRADSSTVGSGQSNSNPSDKLAKSNGVICPPSGVDPEMQVPPPGGGKLLIVPPPGGPGGDPKTIPK